MGERPRRSLLGRALRRIRREAGLARDRAQDALLGIQAHVPPYCEQPDPSLRNARYEPANYEALQIIQAKLHMRPDDVFWDIGCGMGRVVCHFARADIAKSVGIEFDPLLSAAAIANAERLRGRKAEIEIRTGDAAVQDYSGGTVFFLYNPFSAEVLEPVLRRIEEARAGGLATVCYANPVAAACVDAAPWLKAIETFTAPYLGGLMPVRIWQSL